VVEAAAGRCGREKRGGGAWLDERARSQQIRKRTRARPPDFNHSTRTHALSLFSTPRIAQNTTPNNNKNNPADTAARPATPAKTRKNAEKKQKKNMSGRPAPPPSIRELPQRDAERICATHLLPSLGVALQELLLNAVEAGARRVVATLSGGSGAGSNRQNPPPIARACVEDDGHGVRADDLIKLGKWGFSSKGGGGGGFGGGGRGVALAALGALAPAAVAFDSLASNSNSNNSVMRATFGGSSSSLHPTTSTQVGLAPERVQRLWREQQRRQGSRVSFAPPRSMLSLQGQNATTASSAASEVARAREALAIAALPFQSVHVELVWRQEEDEGGGDNEGARQQQPQQHQPELVLEMPSGRSVRDTLAVLFPHAPALTGVKADGDGTTMTTGGMSGAGVSGAPANANSNTKAKLRGYVDNPGTATTNKSTIPVDTHCPRLVFFNGRRVCCPPLEAALSRWHACAAQRAAKQALALLGGGSSSSSSSSFPMAYALFLTLPVECASGQQQHQQQMSPALWRLLAPLLRSALRPAWGDPGRDAEALMAAFEEENGDGRQQQHQQDDGKPRSRRSNKGNSGGGGALSFGGGGGGRKRWRGGARSGGGGGIEWSAAAPAAPPAAAAGPVSAPFALPGLTSMHAESRSRVIVSGKQQQPNDVPTAAAVLATADLGTAPPPPPPPQPILTAAELARRLQQSTEALGPLTSGQQQQEHVQGPALPVPAAVVVGGTTTTTTTATRPLARSDLSRALVVGQAEPSRWLLAVIPPGVQGDNRTALIAIDPHAADERVLLERLQRGLQGQLRGRQRRGVAVAAGDGEGDDDNDHSIVEVLGPPTRLRPPQALRLTPQERDALRGGGGNGGNGPPSSPPPSSCSVASALNLWGWAWASDDSTTSSSGLQLLAVPTVCGTPLTAWDFLGHLSALMGALTGASAGGGGEKASSAAPVAVPPGAQRALRSKACRSALMFGDALEPQQARGLVEALASSRLWTACAHGRPTAAALMVVGGGGGGGVLGLPRAPLMLPPPHEVLEALEEQRRKRSRMGGGVEEEEEEEAGQQEVGLAERLHAHLARCEEKRRTRKERTASGGGDGT
jgi:DNA mismatch repair ATPase MutL